MKKKKENRGGAREGAGRKPLPDEKKRTIKRNGLRWLKNEFELVSEAMGHIKEQNLSKFLIDSAVERAKRILAETTNG